MSAGKCPLCLQTRGIVSSHLIPRAIYDLCRPADSEPVKLTNEVAIQTSRQYQHPLLCLDCEELLNRQGEDWLLPLLATLGGKSPFYDMLTTCEPDAEDDGMRVYAATRNQRIQAEKIAHFAMGVFWKASIHPWSGTDREPLIQLGPYRDAVRTFLRKETPFPANMALVVGVLPPPVKIIAFNVPYRGSKTNCHNFLFYVPGIAFALSVGKSVSPKDRKACFASNPLHPILVADFSPDVTERFREVWQKAKKSKKLTEYLKSKGKF